MPMVSTLDKILIGLALTIIGSLASYLILLIMHIWRKLEASVEDVHACVEKRDGETKAAMRAIDEETQHWRDDTFLRREDITRRFAVLEHGQLTMREFLDRMEADRLRMHRENHEALLEVSRRVDHLLSRPPAS